MLILCLNFLSLSLYNKERWNVQERPLYKLFVIYNLFEAKEEHKNSEEHSFFSCNRNVYLQMVSEWR